MDDVKEIIDLAKEHMLHDGYHAPIVFVKGAKGKAAVVLESFGDTADKRATDMFYAGALVADKRNVGELELIVFVNEAWMSTNLGVMPSQDPNRVEVLLIDILDTNTQEEQLTMFEVIRDSNRKIVDLKQQALPENGSAKGMLLPAFQKGYQVISPVLN